MAKKLLLIAALSLALSAFSCYAQRIAVLSDIHVSPGNRADSVLHIAVDEINSDDYDLVVMCGDLTNEGSDKELNNVKSTLDLIRHPLYVIPGNHENNWSQSATKTFIDLWGDDKFLVELDSLVIVGLNCGPFMKMGDGHVKQEDLHWLRKTLSDKMTAGKKVLSFNHYPLMDDIDNWRDYVNLLSGFPVIGHINGHHHSWKQYKAGDIDAAMVRALYMKNGDYGYSIIELTPTQFTVLNKPIGKAPEIKYTWMISTEHHTLSDDSYPGFTIPAGFNIEKVWTDSASVFTRLAFDRDNVYFGNSLGHTRAVDKLSGALQWSTSSGASLFSRPVVLRSGLIASPCADGIMLLDSQNGRVVRKHQSPEGPYVADGLCVDDLYIQGAYKRIECRDALTADLRWSYDSIFNYCQAAPSVDGDDIIFGAWDTNLRCLDLKTGALKWVWNNGRRNNLLGPGNVVPAVTSDRVIIVAPDRYMTALDRKTGAQLWRDNSRHYRESLGLSEDSLRVYAKTMDGELVAVDAASPEFKELWIVDMGIGYEHAPCIVAEKDGVVYAGSRRGVLTAVDPFGQKVLWSIHLGVSEINGIDIDPYTSDIYVSLIEGTIYKISRLR